MAIEIDKMFTVNEESLRHSLDILIGQRLNFRPISKEKLIELIKVDMSEIPFDGTIIERNKFIEEKLEEIFKEYEEKGKLEYILEKEKEEVKNENN